MAHHDSIPAAMMVVAIMILNAFSLDSWMPIRFWYQNRIGIHESSEKAFKIMIATTIMAAGMLSWCAITLAQKGPAPVQSGQWEGPRNTVPLKPNLEPDRKS